MNRTNRIVIKLVSLVVIGFSIAFCLWMGDWMSRQRDFYATRHRIDATLQALDPPPPSIKKTEEWQAAVDQTTTAIGNILHSPSLINTQQLHLFERDLDAKLARPISPETILWIWDRLARTGPFASDYVARYKPLAQKYLDNAINCKGIRSVRIKAEEEGLKGPQNLSVENP